MHDLHFADHLIERLRERHPRYHERAYLFVLAALNRAMSDLETPRHISGRELAEGAKRVAIERFGPMARTVLEHWGIHTTVDLGDIVFALVEHGVLVKQEEDSREDFVDVFDFEDAFGEYPWTVGL